MQNLATFLGGMFLGGLLGSGHCIGMCGGFAVSIGSLCPRMPAGLLNQAIYSVGRIFTYAFLGAVAGMVGERLSGPAGTFATAQKMVAVAAGTLMIGVGCGALGLAPCGGFAER